MDPLHAILLAIVQGLSEFLPISSSGHLVLTPYFFGWRDQGHAFDVAVHVGTLLAVVAYFRRELVAMSKAWLGSLTGCGMTTDARLAWCVIGDGSNLVASDAGYRGLVIQNRIHAFAAIDTSLAVCAGDRLHEIILQADRVGLAGLEKLAGS